MGALRIMGMDFNVPDLNRSVKLPAVAFHFEYDPLR